MRTGVPSSARRARKSTASLSRRMQPRDAAVPSGSSRLAPPRPWIPMCRGRRRSRRERSSTPSDAAPSCPGSRRGRAGARARRSRRARAAWACPVRRRLHATGGSGGRLGAGYDAPVHVDHDPPRRPAGDPRSRVSSRPTRSGGPGSRTRSQRRAFPSTAASSTSSAAGPPFQRAAVPRRRIARARGVGRRGRVRARRCAPATTTCSSACRARRGPPRRPRVRRWRPRRRRPTQRRPAPRRGALPPRSRSAGATPAGHALCDFT